MGGINERNWGSSTAHHPSVATRAWSVAGFALALASVGWGTLSVAGLVAHGESQRDSVYDADGLQTIVLDVESGSITVVGADVDDVTVQAEIGRGLFSTGYDERVVDGALRIDGDCPAVSDLWCDVDVTVTIPERLTVDATSENGTIVVRDVDGDVDVDGHNGAIRLDGTSGRVRVANRNGSIGGEALASASVTATNENGSIELSFSTAPSEVVVRTANGGIAVDVPDDGTPYRVDARSDNGSSDVAVPTDPASDRTLDLATRNGGVRVGAR